MADHSSTSTASASATKSAHQGKPGEKGEKHQVLMADQAAGSPIDGCYRVVRLQQRESPAGKTFILGEIADSSRRIGLVCWHPPRQGLDQFLQASHILVQGTIESYRDRLQVQAKRVALATPSDEQINQLAEAPAIDLQQLWDRLDQLLASISDPALRAVCDKVFSDSGRRAALSEAPAAVRMHHARPAGLLEHTVCVAELAQLVCARYPQLDADLVVAAALLHDICKLDELEWDKQYSYSRSGNLLGHVVMGALLLERIAQEIPDLSPERKEILQHLVLSHHGQPEYGAAREPRCAEAIALHQVDLLDSQLSGALDAIQGLSSGQWSEPMPGSQHRLLKL